MTIIREQVPFQDKWNVEGLYQTFEDWQSEFESSFPAGKTPRWPEMEEYRERLADPASLKSCLDFIMNASRHLEKLYTYAHLRHDEDITNDTYKTAYQKIMSVAHEFAQETAWFEPVLLSLPKETLDNLLLAPLLTPYHFHLEKILRGKEHTLSADNEQLLALSGKALQTARKAFSALNDADFAFGTVQDSEGKVLELTHANYGLYVRSQDRHLRENAFKSYHGHYKKYENTLAELLSGQVETHVFNAKARKYTSSLQAALFPKNIDEEVYHALVTAVNENLGPLHKYMALRKKVLDLNELHLFDLSVPLIKDFDLSLTFDEALEAVISSAAPLGDFYHQALSKGLTQERWVDRYENKNKRSGAYSSGCYDSMPYILMNYKDKLRDAFTLAHEAGHSMHSLLSHQNQPFQYGDYPIFLAEVASTFNEALLTRYLLENARSREQKIFLINQQIEDIRATLFRQTMFAEFEWKIHTLAERQTPLTPALLSEEFYKLNTTYFGQQVFIDPEIGIEWARIPHFYYNFYVYQYATGISAALALSERVVNGGAKERDQYLSFLKGGSSRYPIELLKMAGVDMTTPAPVKAAIKKFETLVDELDDLLALSDCKC